MTGDNAELAMLGLILTILILIFAVVWFFFLVPMEKGLHKRRMELLRKKLQQNEERLRREADERSNRNSVKGNAREQAAGPTSERAKFRSRG
jgi:flagellar biosynthesis/type III secretory pathway M-ring protein FliF/YscJ